MDVGVLVCDLDRTLTDSRLRVVPSALQAVQRVRRAGVRTVLATGRSRSEVAKRLWLPDAFDAAIVEGGGLAGPPDRLEPTQGGQERIGRLADWLSERGIPRRLGQTVLSVSRRDRARLRRCPLLKEFSLHTNRDRVDVTLRGVDKGRALRRIISRAGWRTGRVLAIGDGENDVSLLLSAHHRVAVANAAPVLRRLAHEVTRAPGGRGVAEFLNGRLLDGGRG